MNRTSPIYRNLKLYRLTMNALYLGKYKNRFRQIESLIGDGERQVVELCFGDTHIAEWCQKTGRSWIGFDTSQQFVQQAKSLNLDARLADIAVLRELPKSDVCILAGSLYHFHRELPSLLQKILSSSRKFILSEPVSNWSGKKGFFAGLASRFGDAGKGPEAFRYDENSLLQALEQWKQRLNYNYEVVEKGKDMVVMINPNGN